MQIDYHPLLFNPVFWHLWEAYNDPKIRHIYCMGGSSAAKTYEAVQALALCCAQENSSAIVFRKELASVTDTIENDLVEINERLRLEMVHQKFNFILGNNSHIRFRGLDKTGKVKGLKGFKRLLADELDQFDFKDFRELRRRLRGQKGQQLIYTWNPVDEDHWIKKDVLDHIEWIEQPRYISPRPEGALTKLHKSSGKWKSSTGESILIKTTYLDNFYIRGNPVNPDFGFVDKHALDEFEFMRDFDENEYQIYALGNWGAVRTGFEYYNKYDPKQHQIEPVRPVKGLPLHISFDFNSLPYMTLNVWQVIQDRDQVEFRCIDEYSMRPPLNTIEDTCRAFLDDYEDMIKSAGVYVYGDSTGKNSIPMKAYRNLYEAIVESMDGYVSRGEIRLLKSNPLHKLRRREINKVLYEHGQFKLRLSNECEQLLKDLKRVQQDANGGKAKPKTKENGVTFETLGHHSDAMDYFLCYILEKIYNVTVFNSRRAA